MTRAAHRIGCAALVTLIYRSGATRRGPTTASPRPRATGRRLYTSLGELRRRQIRHDGLAEGLLVRSERAVNRLRLLHDRAYFFARLAGFARAACRLHDRAQTVQLWLMQLHEGVAQRL